MVHIEWHLRIITRYLQYATLTNTIYLKIITKSNEITNMLMLCRCGRFVHVYMTCYNIACVLTSHLFLNISLLLMCGIVEVTTLLLQS